MTRLLWTMLGLASGLIVLGSIAPRPEEPIHREARQLGKYCEVLFVGPSYVNSQVLPDVIDAEAARRGVPLKSCKYARTSLKGFELRLVLDTLLREQWPHLKLVVVDITLGPDTRFAERNAYTSRVLRWHTWDFLRWYLDHTQGQKVARSGLARKTDLAERFSMHLKHVVVNTLLVGRGSEHLTALSEHPTEKPWIYKPPTKKKALQKQARENKKRVKTLLRRREEKRTRIAPHAMGGWLKELRDVVRSHGVEADGLIAPVWSPAYVSSKPFPDGDPPVVHAFDDPIKYPVLYRSDSHTKSEHLSSKGSHHYSVLLGSVLAERMKTLP